MISSNIFSHVCPRLVTFFFFFFFWEEFKCKPIVEARETLTSINDAACPLSRMYKKKKKKKNAGWNMHDKKKSQYGG